jgi:hypothetical protein
MGLRTSQPHIYPLTVVACGWGKNFTPATAPQLFYPPQPLEELETFLAEGLKK